METQKCSDQKWQYNPSNRYYYLNLPDGSNISVERRTLSYNDQSKKYLEFAWFDRATGDVTADVCTQDMFGSKRVETNSPPKIVEHKDLFLKAPGLSKPARTLAHIIFEALE